MHRECHTHKDSRENVNNKSKPVSLPLRQLYASVITDSTDWTGFHLHRVNYRIRTLMKLSWSYMGVYAGIGFAEFPEDSLSYVAFLTWVVRRQQKKDSKKKMVRMSVFLFLFVLHWEIEREMGNEPKMLFVSLFLPEVFKHCSTLKNQSKNGIFLLTSYIVWTRSSKNYQVPLWHQS